jgi:hypothetical protein
MVTSIVLSFIWGLSIVHLKFHGWKRLLKIAHNVHRLGVRWGIYVRPADTIADENY